MKRTVLLIVGCVYVTAPLSHADRFPAELAPVEAGADLAAAPDDVAVQAIGQFHLIRLANTRLCVQPQGGTTADAALELRACNPGAPEQNWIFSQTPNGFAIVNNKSGKCIYNNSDSTANGGPVVHGACNVFGSDQIASNALWKPSATTGLATLMSRVRFRDSGFCLDTPNGDPFDGATLWMWSCNGTPAQAWIVGVE